MLAQALTWRGSLFLVSSVAHMRLALLGWTGEGARPHTFRAPYSHLSACLLWTARVVLRAVYVLVIF
jgi:hypothetical protein